MMLTNQQVQIKVCEDAHLDVEVDSGTITGFIPKGETFGNWPAMEGEDPRPTIREVEIAVGDALGVKVYMQKRSVADSGDVTFAFLVPPPADGGLENLLGDIRDASRKVGDAESDLDAAKHNVKNCRANFDLAINNLRRLTRMLCEPNPPLVEFGERQGEDAWRGITIRDALKGLTPKTYDQLEEAGITTMGDYADYTAKNPISTVKGIGEEKLSKISDAEVSFWESWNNRKKDK